ncbi:MAG TPA: hypothetical protein VH120_06185 [Gemmataceae bacterium]|nr:hypothetical protein [Gemmataceae bacterium]
MWHAALVVLPLAAAAADARGQADDRVAALTLSFDRDGVGRVALSVVDPPGGGLNAVAVKRGLIDAIPADWSNVDRRQLGARSSWFLRRWPAPPEKRAVRRLDLKPLLAALQGEGVETLRLTVMVHRFGEVSCNLPARPALPGPALIYIYGENLGTDQPAPPVQIRFGERPTVPRRIVARAGRWSLALAALALAPILVAAWRLRRLAASAETARLGHALWRLHTHGPLATMFAWFVALGLTGGLALAAGWLDGPRPGDWVVRWLVLYAAPPAAAALLAAWVARPALTRLRADNWVGVEMIRRAPWATVWRSAAVVLTASAGVVLWQGHVGIAAASLVAAGVAGVLTNATGEEVHGKVVELPEGELVESVRTFAKILRVRVKTVGVVVNPTRRAEVVPTAKVNLTLPLLREFARPAVDALVAQRFALLAQRSGSLAGRTVSFASSTIVMLGAGAAIHFGDRLTAGVVDWVPLIVAAALVLFSLSTRFATRSIYWEADGRAASLTGPEILVVALAEQARRRGEPPDRSRLEDAFLYCPCSGRRAAALARRHGWSQDDVAQLLAVPAGADPSRYDVPLPPVPERPERKTISAIANALMVGLPLAFAHGAEASPPGAPRTAVLAAGVVGGPLLYWVVLRLIVGRKNAANGRALRGQLRAEGIDLSAWTAVLVGFAPDREPHNYDGTAQWDLGYLVPARERLLFIGRRARVAVPWSAVQVSMPPAGLWQSRRVLVTWDGGGFSVWPAGRHVPWGFARATAELHSQLEGWRDDRSRSDALPAAWADLPPPPPTPQGVKPFRESVKVGVVVRGITNLAVVVLAAACLTGLPFVAEWRGAGYAVAVMVVTVLAFTLRPLLRARRSGPLTG